MIPTQYQIVGPPDSGKTAFMGELVSLLDLEIYPKPESDILEYGFREGDPDKIAVATALQLHHSNDQPSGTVTCGGAVQARAYFGLFFENNSVHPGALLLNKFWAEECTPVSPTTQVVLLRGDPASNVDLWENMLQHAPVDAIIISSQEEAETVLQRLHENRAPPPAFL